MGVAVTDNGKGWLKPKTFNQIGLFTPQTFLHNDLVIGCWGIFFAIEGADPAAFTDVIDERSPVCRRTV